MSDAPPIDPLELAERLADKHLRAASEYDSTRKREASMAVGGSWPPVLVEQWLCRTPPCGAIVEVTQDAVDAAAVFERELARRGEAPLKRSQIVYCDSCRAELNRTAPDRRRGQVDRMAPTIRALRESKQPEGEREMQKQLREWGHPDVDGLVLAIRARLDGPAATKKGRREV